MPACICGLAVFADAWLSGWLAEISADLREVVVHWRRVSDDALYNGRVYFTYFLLCCVTA